MFKKSFAFLFFCLTMANLKQLIVEPPKIFSDSMDKLESNLDNVDAQSEPAPQVSEESPSLTWLYITLPIVFVVVVVIMYLLIRKSGNEEERPSTAIEEGDNIIRDTTNTVTTVVGDSENNNKENQE